LLRGYLTIANGEGKAVLRNHRGKRSKVQASLLVVNGGAALAILQSQAVPAHVRTFSGALFVLGIVSSLYGATMAVGRVTDAPAKFAKYGAYWLGVGIDLLRVEATEREWEDYGLELQRRMRLPKFFGYAAAVCFVLGCIVVGVGTF
jgi:hypothetical protein